MLTNFGIGTLEAEIRRIIVADGPMPVGQFMTLCLSHPVHGYYATRDPLGAAGDFVTAPEITQMFGELIGLWAVSVWRQMGAPARIRLVELGPGRGTLMADALRAAKVVPAFRAALAVDLVELSPVLRRRQAETLGRDVPLAWYRAIAEVPDGPAIFVANEFIDATPVDQAVRAADGWHARMIGIGADGGLAFALHPDPIPGGFLPAGLGDAPVGSLFEWRSEHLVTELAARVVRHGGAVLVIDYGHAESLLGETLQAVRRHDFAPVLERPGEVDLTAHVDFAALQLAATRAGAAVHGPVGQGEFLRRLGIEARAAALRAAAPDEAAEIDTALERLVGSGPDNMGELFKAVAITDQNLGTPPGFEGSPLVRPRGGC